MPKRMPVRALVAVVEASHDASEEARRGLEVRAQAMLTGRCACGAELQLPGCLEHNPLRVRRSASPSSPLSRPARCTRSLYRSC